jgi:hypothetical protein
VHGHQATSQESRPSIMADLAQQPRSAIVTLGDWRSGP